MGVRRRSKGEARWRFMLFVAGESPVAHRALQHLHATCRTYLGRDYDVEVVDLANDPEKASQHQIFATPTVVRLSPLPTRRVIGDLSVEEQLITGLDLDETERGRHGFH